ncbi:MAG: flagellar biosynthesis repressor FlbT [Rhodopseudomonas palustris]|nr:flagellar biosynthesis repressor FlbT [Rhodopseudomonas palustris]
MGLKITLKPFERIEVGPVTLINGWIEPSTFSIEGTAPVLRQANFMPDDRADTTLRQVYLCCKSCICAATEPPRATNRQPLEMPRRERQGRRSPSALCGAKAIATARSDRQWSRSRAAPIPIGSARAGQGGKAVRYLRPADRIR